MVRRSDSSHDKADDAGLAHDDDVRRLFDSKASKWRAKYFPGGALGQRVGLFTEPLGRLAPPPTPVLDLGCGTGDLATHLADKGYEVTGADVSDQMLAEAQARCSRVSWVQLAPGWTRLPFDDGMFAAVVMSSVLEYVGEPDRVMAECARVVRPGGIVEFTVPDMRHPMRLVEQVLQRMLRWASTARVSLHPRHAYLRYLLLSRNRMSHVGWASLASKHTLEAIPGSEWGTTPPARTPLELFVLRRNSP